jgi:hypothetical protein
MTTRQDYLLACSAIEDKHPNAWSIVQHDDTNFSAKVGHCMAYYVIIDNEIIGDIWYE